MEGTFWGARNTEGAGDFDLGRATKRRLEFGASSTRVPPAHGGGCRPRRLPPAAHLTKTRWDAGVP